MGLYKTAYYIVFLIILLNTLAGIKIAYMDKSGEAYASTKIRIPHYIVAPDKHALQPMREPGGSGYYRPGNVAPKYYINRFKFVLSSEITKGYTGGSTLVPDAEYVEPAYIYDSKRIFFNRLFRYIGNVMCKNYEVLDIYDYMEDSGPTDPWQFTNEVLWGFLDDVNYEDALILYGHNVWVQQEGREYFVYLDCANTTYSYGVGRTVDGDWVSYVCGGQRIYYMDSYFVRNIYRNRPLSRLPGLVYFMGCGSGRHDTVGSWRWAFRLSGLDPYDDWLGRAFIGLYTANPWDARVTVWDDLLYYIVSEVNSGDEDNMWEAFNHYLRKLHHSYGVDVGYRAVVQFFMPGIGFVRIPQNYRGGEARLIYVYAGDRAVYIDPDYRDRLISFARNSLKRYLGSIYDLISHYIVGARVEKGASDALFDRYTVDFILDENTFKRGRHLTVYIYVYKSENIMFTMAIDIGVGIGGLGFTGAFEKYLFDGEYGSVVKGIVEALRERGFTVINDTKYRYSIPEHGFYYEDAYYRVYYGDAEVSLLGYYSEPLFRATIYYDTYREMSFSIDLETPYELILYLVDRGYSFPKFNISRSAIEDVIDRCCVNASVADFIKLYIPYTNGFKPVYHASYQLFGSFRSIYIDGETGKVIYGECCKIDACLSGCGTNLHINNAEPGGGSTANSTFVEHSPHKTGTNGTYSKISNIAQEYSLRHYTTYLALALLLLAALVALARWHGRGFHSK